MKKAIYLYAIVVGFTILLGSCDLNLNFTQHGNARIEVKNFAGFESDRGAFYYTLDIKMSGNTLEKGTSRRRTVFNGGEALYLINWFGKKPDGMKLEITGGKIYTHFRGDSLKEITLSKADINFANTIFKFDEIKNGDEISIDIKASLKSLFTIQDLFEYTKKVDNYTSKYDIKQLFK